jgi:hypothetical protein
VQAEIAEILIRARREDWRTQLRWFWEQSKRSLRGSPFTRIGVTTAVVLLAWLVWHARKEKLCRQIPLGDKGHFELLESAPALAELLRSLDRYWTICGVTRPAHRAPLERLETIPAAKVPPGIRRAARHLIESYYLASFGGMALPTEELLTLQREFDCARSSSTTDMKSRLHD